MKSFICTICLLLVFVIGCFPKPVNWDEWRQEVLVGNPDLFADPGEKEVFLAGGFCAGMTVREVGLSLEARGYFLELKYSSSDGWGVYEYTYHYNKYNGREMPTTAAGAFLTGFGGEMVGAVDVTLWFKDGKLDHWSEYFYDGY